MIKIIDTIADSVESWMLGTQQNGVGDDEKEKEEVFQISGEQD